MLLLELLPTLVQLGEFLGRDLLLFPANRVLPACARSV